MYVCMNNFEMRNYYITSISIRQLQLKISLSLFNGLANRFKSLFFINDKSCSYIYFFFMHKSLLHSKLLTKRQNFFII